MKVYVTDGDTIVLEDDTSYQLVCCDCGLTHELEVRRLSPGHRTLIKIRRISESRIAELEAANAEYKAFWDDSRLADRQQWERYDWPKHQKEDSQ